MHKLFSTAGFILAALSLLMPSSLALSAPKARTSQIIEQIDFREVTVGDALKVLADQSNLNIVASKEAADIHVTLFLRRVTPMEVVDALAKTYNLWYQRDPESNIVRLYTVKEYRLEKVEFRKEETEVFTMKNAKNVLDLADSIQNLFSTRVRLGYGSNQIQLMTDLQQRFARFNMVDSRSKVNTSIGAGTTGSTTGGGVVGVGGGGGGAGIGIGGGGVGIGGGVGGVPRLSHKNFTCLSIDSRVETESVKSSMAA
jgi:general secretion pathway protein D